MDRGTHRQRREDRGQRTEELADYSPWGRKESDMIERLSAHTIHIQLTVFYFFKCPFSFLMISIFLSWARFFV